MAAAYTARRPSLLLNANNSIDGELKNLVNTAHFLAAAFDVFGSHALCDSPSLLWCNRGETLGFEKVNAGAFISEIRFKANEDEGGGWAEMKDFGVPLRSCVSKQSLVGEKTRVPTLSITFSSETGQSMAKQTNKRSVSGYDKGRRRSYSSWPAVSHRASSTVFPDGACIVCVM